MKKLMVGVFAAVAAAVCGAADVSTVAELRAAIADQETYPNGSTITLAATTFNIGMETDTTPIKVNRPLTLTGESRTGTVIPGGGVTRCLEISGADVVLSNLTVADGYQELTSGNIQGVGVSITGARAKIVGVDFRDCNAKMLLETSTTSGNIRGGAIYVNAADCEIRDCRITDCTITNAGGGDKEQVTEGSGLYTGNATLKVYGTLFRNCVAVNSSTRSSSISSGAACNGSYYGCTFESNVAWRTLAAKDVPDASAVYGAAAISNCYFRGNLATQHGAIGATARITDSTFVGNVSSNGYGSCLHIGNVGAESFPVVERCLFESNVCLRIDANNTDKARGGAILMDYVGGVVVSNCVFRGNKNVNAAYGAAISGRSASVITVYGSVFDGNIGGTAIYDDGGAKISVERCLFTGEAKRTGGAIYADCYGGGYFTVRNSLFNQVDATGYSVCFFKTSTARATFENCSMIGCKGAVFSIGNGTSEPYLSLTACCLWGNGSEGLSSRVTDITYSYLLTDTAATRAAENHNIVSGNNPGYWQGLKDVRVKASSVLRDAGGEAKPWMGDGSADGVQDMGNGKWSFKPCGTVTADGETHEVGAKITFEKTNPRLVNGIPDIGCSEYMLTEDPEPEGTAVSTLAELRAALADRSGDGTIILKDGTYDLSKESDQPAPVVIGRTVTLRGESRTGAVIDAGGVTRCLEITGADVLVTNLTLKGGFIEETGDNAYGAGVYSTGARTTLGGVDIENCYGHLDTTGLQKSLGGFGVYFGELGGQLVGCRIRDCGGFLEGSGSQKYQCGYGAGVYCQADGVVRETLFQNCCMTNSSPNESCCCYGAAYRGSFYGCVFETNVAWRTVTAVTAPDAGAVASATVISNCLFRGNLTTRLSAVTGTGSIKDSSFIGNISSNGYGAALYIGSVTDYPVVERCLFDGNKSLCLNCDSGVEYKAHGGAIGMDYVGGVVVSNCVFRNNDAGKRSGGAIGGRSGSVITAYGCVFDSNKSSSTGADIYDDGAKVSVERCLFTGEAKAAGGAIYADVGGSGYLTVLNSLFNQVDSTSATMLYMKSTGGLATYRQCSMIGCKGTLFGFNNETSGSYASLTGCCLYKNGSEGLGYISDVTYSYLKTDKSGEGNIVSSDDPGFVAYPTDLRLKRKSVLVDAGGAAEPWMGDGTKKSMKDMGDGTYTAEPSATITVAGKDYEVGAKVVFCNAHPRLVHDIPDIGAGEYYCPPGMLLLVK